ncbi:Fpg/Nei family DNA glycosylase [Mycobacterium sp. Y57]|uniref:Fpg/Nei family DNA glycosylase n=1 Tax=Mycolicibacterium xanthum TaxID=2796469 RepID=UPI001C85B2DB|nr:DNA-formamidopyrimidine glycosylase family protein [Mycolicibacterium xanthum]MBX7434112.1 Fpg/Nei family DNA glycosylase [Mycolicibacterium xanthum]
MPELPEVEALADHLRRHAVGLTVRRVDVSALSVLKTFDPPVSALAGVTVTGANRWGKYLGLQAGGLHLITHLSRAGWLRWSDKLAAAPLKPGKGPIALRVHLEAPGAAPGSKVAAGAAPGSKVAAGAAPGFDLTEAGTQKRLAVWLVTDPMAVPQIASLGPDALSLDTQGLADALEGNSGRLKTVITDQKVIAGIGNAYSDEILHVAKLSPFATAGKLTDAQLAALHDAMIGVLTDAVTRSVGQQAAMLKGEKRSGLRVHARTGLPCPVCGDTVREVSFADKSFQYCPTCQTGGKVLADRRMSKLLK